MRSAASPQPEALQQPADPRLQLAAADAVQAALERQVLAAGGLQVDPGALGHAADGPAHAVGPLDHVDAGHAGGAGVRAAQRGEDLDGGGLAGAVGTEQAEHCPRLHGEAEAPQGADVARIGLDQVLDLDRRWRARACGGAGAGARLEEIAHAEEDLRGRWSIRVWLDRRSSGGTGAGWLPAGPPDPAAPRMATGGQRRVNRNSNLHDCQSSFSILSDSWRMALVDRPPEGTIGRRAGRERSKVSVASPVSVPQGGDNAAMDFHRAPGTSSTSRCRPPATTSRPPTTRSATSAAVAANTAAASRSSGGAPARRGESSRSATRSASRPGSIE